MGQKGQNLDIDKDKEKEKETERETEKERGGSDEPPKSAGAESKIKVVRLFSKGTSSLFI